MVITLLQIVNFTIIVLSFVIYNRVTSDINELFMLIKNVLQ